MVATIFFLQFNSIKQLLCCHESKEKTKQERCFTLLKILVLEISAAQDAILGTTYFPPSPLPTSTKQPETQPIWLPENFSWLSTHSVQRSSVKIVANSLS